MKHWMLLALLCAGVSALHGLSTALTYHGRLMAYGVPANGSHDLQFTLFAVGGGGSPASNPITISAVGVTIV